LQTAAPPPTTPTLSAEDKLAFEIAQRIFAEQQVLGASSTHEELTGKDYRLHPVGPEQFLTDDAYAGKYGSGLYKLWREELIYVLEPSNGVTEWILCLAGDTQVPLLDGTQSSLEELYAKWKLSPEPFWVYSVDQKTGEIVPGECTRVTKFADDKLFKVTLDDGSTFRGNADHEMVMRDGTKRKIRDLQSDDRLMPFTTTVKKMEGKRLTGYEQVYLPGPQKYAYTHRVVGRMLAGGVCPKSVDGDRAVLHHIDMVKSNNAPENLKWMGWSAHRELHRFEKSPEHLATLSRLGTERATDPDSAFRRGHQKFMQSGEGKKLSRCNLSKADVSNAERKRRGDKGRKNRWADPEQRRAASERMSKRNVGNQYGAGERNHRFREDVTVESIYETYQSCERLQDLYDELGCNRKVVVRVLDESGLTLDDLKANYQNHRVVSVEEDGVEPVYCLTVPEWENFAISTNGRCGVFSGNTGAIGLGKSTIAALAMCYKLYRIGCLIDPASFFRLMADSGIVFGVYSLFKYKSQDDNYGLLKTMIDGIPFFKDNFPRPKHRSPSAADTLEFPNRVSVIAGSTELHALGLNLLCLLMDEVNFMKEVEKSGTATRTSALSAKVSQAQELYTASLRRLESRFQFKGLTPGLMILISSRNAESSWLELHMQEYADAPHVHVSDYSLWEVKAEVMGYSGKRFFVEVGDFMHPSKIIESPRDARADAAVVSPPVEHLDEFERDIEGALRDIAGVANIAVAPLIRQRESLKAAIDPKLFHPFTAQQFPISHLDDIPISRFFLPEQVIQINQSFPRPRLNPTAPRFIHVDLAESQDAAGIAMGHVSDIVGSNPRITIDFKLRLLAPSEGEIDFSKIIDFVLYLFGECGYPIKRVSFDRFQSTHSRQILTKLGFESPHFSVDRTDEAYIVLRSTLYEGRLSTYDYPPFFDELAKLIHDVVKKKVDHPQGGSKDCSDAVAGVVAQLTEAIGTDKTIQAHSGGQMITPEPVKSLQERLEETGAMATAASAGKLV